MHWCNTHAPYNCYRCQDAKAGAALSGLFSGLFGLSNKAAAAPSGSDDAAEQDQEWFNKMEPTMKKAFEAILDDKSDPAFAISPETKARFGRVLVMEEVRSATELSQVILEEEVRLVSILFGPLS